MDKLNFIAVDNSQKDKLNFIPILIQSNLSKTGFLVYGNVPVVFFIFSFIIFAYIIVTIDFTYLSGLAGLLSASSLTLILLILRENYNSRNKERTYFQAFMNELESNMMVMYSNLNKIKLEKGRFDGNHLNIWDIEPYYHVQFDIWNSLKQNMSLNFLKIDIRNFDAFIFNSHIFNEMIEARDNALKNPLIKVKPTDDAPLDIFTNVFLIKKMYNEMLLEQCEKVIQYLENVLESRGKLIKLDFNSHKQYKSFNDAIAKNGIIIPNSEDKRKYEILYSAKNEKLIFYQYTL